MTFLRVIQEEDYERATEYLDSRLKPPERQELARKLGVIFDRKLSARLTALSDKPDGHLDDGLRPNRDLLGIIPSDSGNVDVLLDRVQRGKDRPIWLFSAESLREVPRLYGELEETWVERYVPEPLRTRRWLSLPLYQWIEGLLGLPLILGLASILTRLLTASLRPLLRRLTQEQDDRRLTSLTWPLRLEVLSLLIYGISRYAASLLASTGTPATFLHGTEASHGSAGQVAPGDVVIAVSNSGDTDELRRAVETVRALGARIVGVSGNADSWLAQTSEVFLHAGVAREGGGLGLAPRASFAAEVLVLASLSAALERARGFTAADYAARHPAGALGRRARDER